MLFITHDIDEVDPARRPVYVMTARPGRIKEMVQIDIERPRSMEVLTCWFAALKRHIMALVHEEALRAMQ